MEPPPEDPHEPYTTSIGRTRSSRSDMIATPKSRRAFMTELNYVDVRKPFLFAQPLLLRLGVSMTLHTGCIV